MDWDLPEFVGICRLFLFFVWALWVWWGRIVCWGLGFGSCFGGGVLVGVGWSLWFLVGVVIWLGLSTNFPNSSSPPHHKYNLSPQHSTYVAYTPKPDSSKAILPNSLICYYSLIRLLFCGGGVWNWEGLLGSVEFECGGGWLGFWGGIGESLGRVCLSRIGCFRKGKDALLHPGWYQVTLVEQTPSQSIPSFVLRLSTFLINIEVSLNWTLFPNNCPLDQSEQKRS